MSILQKYLQEAIDAIGNDESCIVKYAFAYANSDTNCVGLQVTNIGAYTKIVTQAAAFAKEESNYDSDTFLFCVSSVEMDSSSSKFIFYWKFERFVETQTDHDFDE